jgi:hypothetical protein
MSNERVRHGFVPRRRPCPPLLGAGAVDTLLVIARKVDARLRKEFDLHQ